MRLQSLPLALALPVSRLPQFPPALAAAFAGNLLWGERINGTQLPAALGKTVEIHVRDAGLRLHFRIVRDGMVACHAGADVTISASAGDFVALASREEDPDTLFFSRRLTMEGDTELGLLLKNTLDAWPAPRFARPAPATVFAAIKRQLRAFKP
jgi:predicted lipid carrier protein YhbT